MAAEQKGLEADAKGNVAVDVKSADSVAKY